MGIEFFTSGDCATATASVNGIAYVTVDGLIGSNNDQFAVQWTTSGGDSSSVEHDDDACSDDWETRSDKRRDDNLREIFGC